MIFLLSRLFIPVNRFVHVLINPISFLIYKSKIELSVLILLFSGFLRPMDCLVYILPIFIDVSKMKLSILISLFSRLFIPINRLVHILIDPISLFVYLGET